MKNLDKIWWNLDKIRQNLVNLTVRFWVESSYYFVVYLFLFTSTVIIKE